MSARIIVIITFFSYYAFPVPFLYLSTETFYESMLKLNSFSTRSVFLFIYACEDEEIFRFLG